MKSTKSTILITIIISIVLFFAGLFSYGSFISFTLPKTTNIIFVTTDFKDSFKQPLYFGLTLALIPLAALFLWRMGSISAINKKILSIGILLVCMILFMVARREMIIFQANHLTTSSAERFKIPMPFASIKFELFALAGLLAGGIISFFALRQK